MTQSEIQNLIDTNIASNSNVFASELRAVLTPLNDEIFVNRASITAQQLIIDAILPYLPVNSGWVGNIDIGAGSPSFTIGGDTVSVTSNTSPAGVSIFTVVFANEMPNMNYNIDSNLELNTGSLSFAGTNGISYKKISTTSFQILLAEVPGVTQDFKLHYKIYKNKS